ncbi:MAG: 3-methylornithyl-N6-L-lysine dehydrogenase PylD [Anaerovorax sp.]
MTRLKTDWIKDIEKDIYDCERYLNEKTGMNFLALMDKVSQVEFLDRKAQMESVKVAIVPITVGLGIIDTFCESVAAIVRVMGFHVFVTEKTDVDGIFEASQRGANVVYLADDHRFIAINLKNGKIADNNKATALGYVTVLEGATGSLKGQEVLLLGYGLVGREIYRFLEEKGATVTVYDKDEIKKKELREKNRRTIETVEDICRFRRVIDATSEGNWITKDVLHSEAWIVTPGVPLSLDEEAYAQCNGRIIHDYLQIGVAVMLGLVL